MMYTKNVKETTTKELIADRYVLNDMVCQNADDGETISQIALVLKMINDEIDYRHKVEIGEIIPEEEIEVEFEDVDDENVDWSVIRYSKETLNTIADFMSWVETPINEKEGIKSDRTYNYVLRATKQVHINDAAIEPEDIAQDIRDVLIYKFMSTPKMHQYFSFDGFPHDEKMKTIYSMYNKYAVSKICRYIDNLNNKCKTTPISYFDKTDSENNTYNPVEDKLMAITDDNDEIETVNDCETIMSIANDTIMNLPKGRHSDEQVKPIRESIVDGLQEIADGKYETASQMVNGKNIHPQKYQNIVNRIRNGNSTMNEISRQTGWYLVGELERQNDWSVEMMENCYGMAKNKGVNDGYYEQFEGVGKTKTYRPGDEGYDKLYKSMKSKKPCL